MKAKTLISIAAACLLAGTGAQAFGFHGNGGSVDVGVDENGFHICIEGHSWMGSGSSEVSYGSASGCDSDDFDFYYTATAGFLQGSAHVDSPNFKPGQDDETQDGFWYREGPFSAPVYYGDPTNDHKRYADNPDAYPAWTWGHPEADPFISEGGAGDNLGGAGGIGTAGFSINEGNKIKAGDDAFFYPIQFLEANNYINSVFGSYSSDVAWHVTLYDRGHNKVFDKNFQTTLYYWETLNYANTNMGIICPRESVAAGEVVNDTAYDQNIHDNVFSRWPVYGLGIDFVSDGGKDTKVCSDPITLKDKSMSAEFTTGNFWNQKKYKITFDGPYLYDASVEGCPALNAEGIPDTTEKWPAKCFKKVDTIWVQEESKGRAFMRMSVEEEKKSYGW